jgi:hypothetical protein
VLVDDTKVSCCSLKMTIGAAVAGLKFDPEIVIRLGEAE